MSTILINACWSKRSHLIKSKYNQSINQSLLSLKYHSNREYSFDMDMSKLKALKKYLHRRLFTVCKWENGGFLSAPCALTMEH